MKQDIEFFKRTREMLVVTFTFGFEQNLTMVANGLNTLNEKAFIRLEKDVQTLSNFVDVYTTRRSEKNINNLHACLHNFLKKYSIKPYHNEDIAKFVDLVDSIYEMYQK